MAALTLRLVKGSPLTNAELDANFSALNTELGTKLVSSDLSGYLTSSTAASTYQTILVSGTSIKTINGTSLLGSGDVSITAGVSSFNTRTGAITLSSGDVTGALGFTPYDSTNPSSYITTSGARSAISVTQNLSYNSSTGVITGPDLSGYLTTSSAASTYLPLAGGTLTGSVEFSGTGLKIAGDFTNGTVASRTYFQTSTANGNTFITAVPNGTAVNSQFQAYNSSDPANASIAALVASSSQVRIVSGYTGTGTLHPITFIFSNTEAARFDPTTRNFLIGTSTDNTTDKLQVNGSISATSITSTSASGISTIQAATQDGVRLLGRAGGTGSYLATLTPTTLTASRTVTLPDANTTIPVATQVITFSGPTAARTYTLPDASTTVLTENAAVTVAQGGTGLTSGTSGGVPYFSSTTAIASSAALTANALVIGGGAGAAPSTTTTGTGVLTALGVNTGTAGAFVVNGGALGTPSSGTVTNLTGTASININGTVGATTANTGAFTTLSASSAVTFAAPVNINATTYTVAATDLYLIYTSSSNTLTLTLPSASSSTGRVLWIKQTSGKFVVSASSNVVPRAGGAAGTAILASGTGAWAHLISDGTNWVIMAGSV